MKEVIVKKSKIEGLGVFALHDFKKGKVVTKWDISHQLTPKEVKKLPEKEKRYVVYLNGSYVQSGYGGQKRNFIKYSTFNLII